jgi:hypothetical protein
MARLGLEVTILVLEQAKMFDDRAATVTGST